MLKWIIPSLLFLNCLLLAQPRLVPPGRSGCSAFAIIIDSATFAVTEKAVMAYKQAVEKDGLPTWVAVDDWQKPEAVRRQIQQLYESRPPIEGVVLVGRIPVPMLRDAQHLTSAFKMDQTRYPWRRSSVPSDRFYDDFDLKFDFLKQAEKEPLLFYYSLRADSTQQINKDIYSARIFPPEKGPKGIARIKTYLTRVAEMKTAGPNPLQRMLLVVGHGFNSDSMHAWFWEHLTLREQLPQLFLPGGWLRSYRYNMTDSLKEIIFRELRMTPVQLAIFHAHGSTDTQYILGHPATPNTDSRIEAVKRYLRARLRRAIERKKPLAVEKEKLVKRFGVPESWLTGATDKKTTAADEALMARQDITAKEIGKLAPRARCIIFDQCFNGCFIDQPCLANEYVVGTGETMVAMGNTVNVLQDTWANMGLENLNHGLRVGSFHKNRNYLESHLLGDPTWRFTASKSPFGKDLAGTPKRGNTSLGARVSTPNIYLPTITRLYLFQECCRKRDNSLNQALPGYLQDPYEFLRRKAAFIMGDVGLDTYALPLLKALIFDPSRRVSFVAKVALQKIQPAAVAAAYAQLQKEQSAFLPQNPAQRKQLERMIKSASWRAKDLKKLTDPEAPLKKRLSAARSFRNYRVHHCLPVLLRVAMDTTQNALLRKTIFEALGWFQYSHRRKEITVACKAFLKAKGKKDDPVRKEAEKTLRRLVNGPNELLTP